MSTENLRVCRVCSEAKGMVSQFTQDESSCDACVRRVGGLQALKAREEVELKPHQPTTPVALRSGTRVLKEAHVSPQHDIGVVLFNTEPASPEGLRRVGGHITYDPADRVTGPDARIEVITKHSPYSSHPSTKMHLASTSAVTPGGTGRVFSSGSTPISHRIVQQAAAPALLSNTQRVFTTGVATPGRTIKTAADVMGPVKTIAQYNAEVSAKIAASRAAGHIVEVVALSK